MFSPIAPKRWALVCCEQEDLYGRRASPTILSLAVRRVVRRAVQQRPAWGSVLTHHIFGNIDLKKRQSWYLTQSKVLLLGWLVHWAGSEMIAIEWVRTPVAQLD